MAKKTNTGLLIIFSIAILLFGQNIGLFSIFPADTEPFFSFNIESDYIIKVGSLKGLDSYAYLGFSGAGDSTPFFNDVIDNAYVVAIFDNPLIVDDGDVSRIVDDLEELNSNFESEINSLQGEPPIELPLFSDELLNTIEKGEYDLDDLFSIINELEISFDKACIAAKEFDEQNTGSDAGDFLVLCENQPENLFRQEGFSYFLDLKDVDIYRDVPIEVCRAAFICSELNCTDFSGPVCGVAATDYSDACQACNNQYSYFTIGICPEIAPNAPVFGGSYPPPTEVCYTTGYERKKTATLRLSDLHLQLTQKAGDIMLALNDEGIGELNDIDGRFDFSQYAFQLEHKDSLNFLLEENEQNEAVLQASYDQARLNPFYSVVSNSDDVVDASNGEIEEISQLSDLWKGIKSGDVAKSPIHLGLLVVIGVIAYLYFKKRKRR